MYVGIQMSKMKRKCVMISDSHENKIRKIREHFGLPSDSEAIRRAIDYFIEEKGISTLAGAESDNPSFSSEVN